MFDVETCRRILLRGVQKVPYNNVLKLEVFLRGYSAKTRVQKPSRQVKVIILSFQEARMLPLYCSQMLSAIDRPMP